ncbi:unnamed protein product [Acanthoscelides obtectus]|nr:unnamed protein product [Acanthoscelides obtectus]CAK1621316.1 Calcium-binding protein E63-1 [Acanthoscelides obtectus]
MLNNLGIEIKEEKVEEIIRAMSHSGSELIDENDFLTFIKQMQLVVPEVEDDVTRDLGAAFQVFDLDGDGYITREELRTAMEMIGESVTESQLTNLIRTADLDNDNRISYEEFVKLLSS